MSKESLAAIATRHQVFLERLKTQTATDFSSVIPELNKAISDVVGALEVDSMDKLTRKQLLGVLIDLKLKQSEIVNKASEGLKGSLKDISEYETGFEARTIDGALTAGGATKAVTSVPSTSKVWKSTIQQPLSATGQLLEPFIDSWGENHIAGVDAAVMKAWGEGRTVSQLMRDIRGSKALNYQDGLAAVSRRQAEAIARTSVQHVAQQARMAVWQENSDLVIGYTFVATLDGRTTSKCRSLDGQTFQMGKGPVPPVHVNCRSTTIPKLPAEFDFLDEGATRSSKDGYVSANQTYYDWLKTQPESFQVEALGASRAKLFRDGGLTAEKFAALNLGKNFEPMTLAQMQVKEPQLFEKTGVVVRGATLSAEPTKLVQYQDVQFSDGLDEASKSLYSKVTGNQPALKRSFEFGDEYATLDNYKGIVYADINRYLRQGVIDEGGVSEYINGKDVIIPRKNYLEKHIDVLDSLMSKSELGQDVYLYRGFSLPKGINFDDISDFTFTDKGFISTTVEKATADRFTFGKDNSNIFKIRAPKGTAGIAVEDRLGYGGEEREVLLPRGTTFRFVGTKETQRLAGKNVNIYEVEIVTE